MVKSVVTCESLATKAGTRWPYTQYYLGDKDQEQRRSGQGQTHWTGAQSIEWYTGRFIRNTMHGVGEYRWRYSGPDGAFVTYEGHFYNNRMHGYGAMSYADGTVFTGLFHNDIRWGPGVMSQACLRQDVGLWRGTRLARLTWRPTAPNVTLDLICGNNGKAFVEPHRIILTTISKTVGEINSAIELLKQCGSDPKSATEKWNRLYPKHCTDLESQLCHVDVFEQDYYNSTIHTLEEATSVPEIKQGGSQDSNHSFPDKRTYFTWNNNKMMVHMMKHCFKHEKQRSRSGIDLTAILTGPRNRFKRAGQHEIDCRTLLMASYLGHITNVVRLVNENNVYPDIADIQGNTALMYATCGDQPEILHFLVEAGGTVDSNNDSCCTPLGVALLRFACARQDIAFLDMVQAVLPPPIIPAPPSGDGNIMEWHMTRDLSNINTGGVLTRTPSKTVKALSTKKLKPTVSEEFSGNRKKTDAVIPKTTELPENNSDNSFSEGKRVYNNINNEFSIRVNDLFAPPDGINLIRYIFEVNDMVKEVGINQDEQKKVVPDKVPKKVVSKVIKDTLKPSKEMMWQSSDKDDFTSVDSVEKIKMERLARMMLTILQLLVDGANPRLVRCPQPALLIATVSGCSDLVRHLVHYGADVNEVYPQTLGYTALDVAVSRPFTYENLELVRAFLECGANADHRLRYGEPASTDAIVPDIPGPTLLHAVLARKAENDNEEEVRRQVVELLLEYNCNPITQFNGRSAMDVAMTKSMDLFDIFIKCPRTNLNAVINDSNQTPLVKMFSVPFCKTVPALERLQTLTNLLLFGADPLLKCQNEQETYPNIFVFARKIFAEMESSQSKAITPSSVKNDPKAKKPDKPKKEEKLSTKSLGKLATDDVGDYKEALDLVTECARLLHIRWLQAKLLKELIEVVKKYKHRQWNMILPEHKNKKGTAVWLTCPRCFEIWDTLKTTKRKVYNDNRILKQVLCIVQFYNRRSNTKFRPPYMTAQEKNMIESDVSYLLYEHNIAANITTDSVPWKRPYVMPELAVSVDEKFNVCFECAMPFNEQKILCTLCKLISFCSFECMRANINRAGCHPCSNYLKDKYFPSPDDSLRSNSDINAIN